MQPGGQRDQHPGDEIGQHDVEGRLSAGQAARSGPDPSHQGIASRIREGRLDRDRVGIESVRRRGAELDGGDREDARAAAHVEHPRPVQATAVGQRFDRRPGTASSSDGGPFRRPCPGSSASDDVVRLAPVASPGRTDDHPAADPKHREVGLPGFGPIGLVDEPRSEIADRPEPERLEMAERLGHARDGPIEAGPIARGQVGPDDGRATRVDPRPEALVDELEGGLDRDAPRRDATEDLADGLDGFDVRVDRELQPGGRCRVGRLCTRRRGRRLRRPRQPPGARRTQPSPSFSRRPPPPDPTDSPASSA